MYKKQVAVVMIENKPMFLVEIQTLDNQESYLTLKKECEKNYNDYVNKGTGKLVSFFDLNYFNTLLTRFWICF